MLSLIESPLSAHHPSRASTRGSDAAAFALSAEADRGQS